jgi:hypothetical protein
MVIAPIAIAFAGLIILVTTGVSAGAVEQAEANETADWEDPYTNESGYVTSIGDVQEAFIDYQNGDLVLSYVQELFRAYIEERPVDW